MDLPLWAAFAIALLPLMGIWFGHWLRIGSDTQARIQQVRMDAYSRCIGSFTQSPLVGPFIRAGHQDTLRLASELTSRHHQLMGEARIYANEAVRQALDDAQEALSTFSDRVDRALKAGQGVNRAMSDAWAEILKPVVDELVAQMRAHLRIR